jgi:hypothetical protein
MIRRDDTETNIDRRCFGDTKIMNMKPIVPITAMMTAMVSPTAVILMIVRMQQHARKIAPMGLMMTQMVQPTART